MPAKYLTTPSHEPGTLKRLPYEANARLIAAAPAVLEALKALHQVTKNGWVTPEDKPTDWQIGWDAACEEFKNCSASLMAEAAISQAEGETK